VSFVSAGTYDPKELTNRQKSAISEDQIPESSKAFADLDLGTKMLDHSSKAKSTEMSDHSGISEDETTELPEYSSDKLKEQKSDHVVDEIISEQALAAPMHTPDPNRITTCSKLESTELFVVDTMGSPTAVDTGLPPPIIASQDPCSSDDEVIVFAGRGTTIVDTASSKQDNTAILSQSELDTKNIIKDRMPTPKDRVEDAGWEDYPNHCLKKADQSYNQEQIPHRFRDHTKCAESGKITKSWTTPSEPVCEVKRPYQGKHAKKSKEHVGRRKTDRATRGQKDSSGDDGLLADYIANMKENGEAFDETFLGERPFEGDDMEMDHISKRIPTPDLYKGHWCMDVDVWDGISTSAEPLSEIVRLVVNRRERECSGIQYLVIWDGYTMDDARWVPASSLMSESAASAIHNFEEKEAAVARMYQDALDTSATEDSDDENEHDNADGVRHSEEDDEDLFQRKLERMSDEMIAKRLEKQMELGIDSNELLLLNGEETDEDYMKPKRSGPPKQHMRTSKRGRSGNFMSASEIADAYDGFDVMDFERPSLQKKSKGQQGVPDFFGAIDSETEAVLRATWSKDRKKKSEKKRERQELRAAGVLGFSKTGKIDLNLKYPNGISMKEVKHEITVFIASELKS
jgi:hypothetical protein